jgi:hypothetical protein
MDAAERAKQDRRAWAKFLLAGLGAASLVGGAVGAVVGGVAIFLGYVTAAEVEAE